jgi:hypothetical protein
MISELVSMLNRASDILQRDVKGSYDGTTSNGAIEIGTMEGTCVISTSNGSVDLWDVGRG